MFAKLVAMTTYDKLFDLIFFKKKNKFTLRWFPAYHCDRLVCCIYQIQNSRGWLTEETIWKSRQHKKHFFLQKVSYNIFPCLFCLFVICFAFSMIFKKNLRSPLIICCFVSRCHSVIGHDDRGTWISDLDRLPPITNVGHGLTNCTANLHN